MKLHPLFLPCFLLATSVVTLGAERRPGEQPALRLVDNGEARATIVIASDATDLQQAPAKELQEYGGKMTGVLLPMADDERTPEGNLVLVGPSRLTQEMGVDLSSLARDSFVLRTAPGRIVLAGNDARLLPNDPCSTTSSPRSSTGSSARAATTYPCRSRAWARSSNAVG